MKVSILNTYDIIGGAARAAYRIHHALRGYGVDSHMLVNNATSGDWTVHGPNNKWLKLTNKLRAPMAGLLTKLMNSHKPILHSPAVLPSKWPKWLNNSDNDVVHLHWVNEEMLSINGLAKISKPIVWTLHDMWAFCGAEHYANDKRWINGYTNTNRPSYESGFDLNRWVWNRKLHRWKHPMQIVTPSRWLAECVRESRLMREWPVTVIPNAIDTDIWAPVDKSLARELFHLPGDIPLLLFGAMDSAKDTRKGYDLLCSALEHLRGEIDGLQLMVFGQMQPEEPEELGFPVHYLGYVHDDVALRLLYSAADAMVIPSRQDNLPNTGVESMACGTPVVAFNTCGLPDVVSHKVTGYLAKPFDTEDLANGISWILTENDSHEFSQASREHALRSWSYEVVASQYTNIYQQAIDAYV